MIVLHYAAMMNSYLDFCMQCSAHTAMQFIAIEITIMHKIQIEWNSIRHFPMGLCREGGRSPVPLWVFHWVWMQCTSFLVISEIRIKKCISPPPFLSVNPHVRSRKLGDSDYYERCLICGEFEARKEASDFTECWCWREREMEEGGERGDEERCEQEVGDICPCLSPQSWGSGAKLPTYHLFSTLQPEPKHQFVSRSLAST